MAKQYQNKSNTKGTEKPKFNGKTHGSRKPKQNSCDNAKLDNTGRDNDPNWYFTSAELATQAAELSFQNYLGAGPAINNYSVPSIMIFRMNATPGSSYQVTEGATSVPTDAQLQAADTTNLPTSALMPTKDGINLMSTKLYTLLSTYSGRTSNYGPQDIAIMHLALGSLIEFEEHIRRIFGVATTYNPRNRMLPLGLLAALGVDGIDLMKNLANYRMRFNVAIARINQIPILDNVGYLKKCREMYQRIYVDEISSMAQYYAYVPNSVWILHEEAVGSWTHGSWLETKFIPTSSTMDGLLSLFESMIDAMLFSSTYNIVYSDLTNLANKISVPFWQFDYLPENYVVMAEYNRNANLQMHNLTIFENPSQPGRGTGLNVNVPWNYTSLFGADFYFTPYNNVYADARINAVTYNPAFPVKFTDMNTSSSYYPWFAGQQLVDMDIDNPTLEDRIESMRFKVLESGYFVSQNETTRDRFFKILPALPDHYCSEAYIFTDYGVAPTLIPSTVRDKSVFPWGASLISQLKNAPLMYLKNNTTYSDGKVSYVYGDLTFFTTIDFNYLYRLNRLMATGLFDFRSGK